MGGTYKTRRKCKFLFTLPELGKEVIRHVVHVDETADKSLAQYDMIIGRDLMTALGIKINFDQQIMTLKNGTAPFKPRCTLNEENIEMIYNLTLEPKHIQDAEMRTDRIHLKKISMRKLISKI